MFKEEFNSMLDNNSKAKKLDAVLAELLKMLEDSDYNYEILHNDKLLDILRELKWNCGFNFVMHKLCETETINGGDLNHVYNTILSPVARAVLRSHNSLDENHDEWEDGGKYLILEQLRLILELQGQLEEWKNELKSIINEKF